MSQDTYRETAILFYMNVFDKIPNSKTLFKKNIELQAQQFFGMFRWLITNLKQADATRLIKRIKILGNMHKKMDVSDKWYELFLQAFHNTMVDATHDRYTPRVRFCMEQLYTVVTNIMQGKDFDSLSSHKISHLLKSLDKLEDCLDDKEGRLYLQMYMKQQFCVELMLFYHDYRRFKGVVGGVQRQLIGKEIIEKYISATCACEINVSWVAKSEVYNRLDVDSGVFSADIFDNCAKQCVELIRYNRWTAFKRSILKLAVDVDMNYEKIEHVVEYENNVESTDTDSTSNHNHVL
eukprot:537414_1